MGWKLHKNLNAYFYFMSETIIRRTTAQNEDFLSLVKQLDAYLAIADGDEHAFYDQFNKLDHIQHVVVIYENEEPVACGAIKAFDESQIEVKRMFTLPSKRGKGYASSVLKELETWSRDMGFSKCILETGKRQEEALKLYPKNGYVKRENYGQYKGIENSVCFEKKIREV